MCKKCIILGSYCYNIGNLFPKGIPLFLRRTDANWAGKTLDVMCICFNMPNCFVHYKRIEPLGGMGE